MKHSTISRRIVLSLAVSACACVLVALVTLSGCAQSKSSSSAPSDLAQATRDNTQTALSFAEAWYGDWTFEDGEAHSSDKGLADRCRSYIDSDSQLARNLERYEAEREAPCSVVQLNVTSSDADSTILEVEYVATQVTGFDQAMYDEMLKNPQTAKLIINFNGSGLITQIDGL